MWGGAIIQQTPPGAVWEEQNERKVQRYAGVKTRGELAILKLEMLFLEEKWNQNYPLGTKGGGQ